MIGCLIRSFLAWRYASCQWRIVRRTPGDGTVVVSTSLSVDGRYSEWLMVREEDKGRALYRFSEVLDYIVDRWELPFVCTVLLLCGA